MSVFDEAFETRKETAPAPMTAMMEDPDHKDYLYRRAEQELELAQAATHPAAVKAHYLLAGHYLDGFYQDAI